MFAARRKERESLEETKSEAEAYVTKEDAIRREKNALYQKYARAPRRAIVVLSREGGGKRGSLVTLHDLVLL